MAPQNDRRQIVRRLCGRRKLCVELTLGEPFGAPCPVPDDDRGHFDAEGAEIQTTPRAMAPTDSGVYPGAHVVSARSHRLRAAATLHIGGAAAPGSAARPDGGV